MNTSTESGVAVTPERRRSFYFGKEINVAFVFMVFMQIIALVWYAAKNDARVTQLEEGQRLSAVKIDTIDSTMKGVDNRLIRIETRLEYALPAPSAITKEKP